MSFISSVKVEDGPFNGQTVLAIVTDETGNWQIIDTILLLSDMTEATKTNLLSQMQVAAERYADYWSKLGLDTVPEL